MKDKKKKMTAAIAAVMSYLQEEEAAIQMQAVDAQAEASATPPTTAFKPWGIAGRQAQMQMRNMIQLKAFHHRVR
jgi:hypothetical protein